MRQLLRVAAEYGVSVHFAHLDEDLGCFVPDEQRVYLDLRLTPAQRRSVLAHELGHVHYGHHADSPLAERQADIYAARLLIDPAEYARLERINPDQHHIADELGVTIDVIYTFETNCLTRLRGVTYVHPRMGAAQWAYRAVPV
ncbi:ImmA/IrrE family metallo-endopeptidase [Microbacterium sp. 2FI]|uniref:ImmA/IrrE family metallo-endopeptidase n=1 Tax=Microbacterium sp. 2FI TaxID=2502193 RepID=UPI0010F55D65|nr:ImmA/IrrE family metallo-endopeptidase [Microbacterium sp. 2FI]